MCAPPCPPARNVELIAGEELDVLIYPEIGMHSQTYYMAFRRLAPVQISTHGNSVRCMRTLYFLVGMCVRVPGMSVRMCVCRCCSMFPGFEQLITT